MAADLFLDPDAETDIAPAYDWYEERRVGLGEEFLACLEACFDAIRRTPKMHQVGHNTARRALIRRFPYAVYYDYTDETNAVTAYVVIHTAQDPDTWRDRLP